MISMELVLDVQFYFDFSTFFSKISIVKWILKLNLNNRRHLLQAKNKVVLDKVKEKGFHVITDFQEQFFLKAQFLLCSTEFGWLKQMK